MKPLKNKFICPACFGNGYRWITKDAENQNLRVQIDCKACNNQGEIKNDKKTIHGLRYLSFMH